MLNIVILEFQKQPKDLIKPIQHTINLQPVARHRISRRDEGALVERKSPGRPRITSNNMDRTSSEFQERIPRGVLRTFRWS
ncbi:Protein CBG25816 [Caenorhabditis briggsae]|uniref:Protein CBG25816 n=1 Tax=Caenorhabditis briggsae TaxID=6238 RepID=B6IEM2_CAEBR|nr:Protein CBG25816 [Caenorhabditis briggsae]CAR98352.1 Protein CBG25816 [Caenorhabditis briggsae]